MPFLARDRYAITHYGRVKDSKDLDSADSARAKGTSDEVATAARNSAISTGFAKCANPAQANLFTHER